MVEPTARIRLYEPRDDKLVRFAIGKANLSCLAVANSTAYTNPLVLSVWIGLSCIFVQYMGWWPRPEVHGVLSYLSPLPAFGSMAVPVMFMIDWINRPYFDKLTLDALSQEDLRDIASYYSKTPGSGFWILEYGSLFVGLLALDASGDAPSAMRKNKSKSKKELSSTATIRHFFIEEPYRATGIQVDLLNHAVQHVFTASSTVQAVQVADSPLALYAREAYKKTGFELEKYTEKVGVSGWKLGERKLDRGAWEKRK